MNATVMDSTEDFDVIKCDSPPAHQWFSSSTEDLVFYELEITLDGKVVSGPFQKFYYYKETQITQVVPNMGPKRGGTEVKVKGFGFTQETVCNMTLRFAAEYVKPIATEMHEMIVRTPPVDVADAVVVSIGMNGQQFIKDKTLYQRDIENTFTYYEDPTVIDFHPVAGLSSGGTKVEISGKGFLPLKNELGEYIRSPVWVRMINSDTHEIIGEVSQAEFVDNENIIWKTPASEPDTRGVISLSLNNREFFDLHLNGKDYSFEYYSSPVIDRLEPAFGEVRHAPNEYIHIYGDNFNCFNKDNCKNVKCRFGTDPNFLYEKAVQIDSTHVKCLMPNFPQPDILPVEISMNGEDYSNDGKTFGFYDPFVLNVSPKLISKKGTTKINVNGFGFVDTSSNG